MACKGCGQVVKLTSTYAKYNRLSRRAVSLEAARTKVKLCGSIIKIGLDVHARLYVAVAQYDQLLPKPRGFLAFDSRNQ